jgi:acyl carrier protein
VLDTMILRIADLLEQDVVDECLLLAVKIWSTEQAWSCIDDAMQMTGGRGYIETNILPRLMRDARVLRIFEGPTEALLHHLGAVLLAGPEHLGVCLSRLGLDPSKADRVHDAASKLQRLLSPGAPETEPLQPSRQRLCLELGRLAVAALVAELAESCVSDEARTFGQMQWREALDRCEETARVVPVSLERLRQHLFALDLSIGDQDPPDCPPQGLDSWLRARPRLGTVPTAASIAIPVNGVVKTINDKAEAEILTWLEAWLSRKLDELVVLDPALPLASVGVDSITAVELADEVGQWLGCELAPEVAWDFSSVGAFATFLGEQQRSPRGADDQTGEIASGDALADLFAALETTGG